MPNKRGGGDVKIKRGSEIFVKFNKKGGQNKRGGWVGGGGVGISKNPLISVMNEKRDINV